MALSAASAVLPTHAQAVNEGATRTLSNVTNIIAGQVTVGTNGSFTLLVLAENSFLTHSGFGTMEPSAQFNATTIVSGAGAITTDTKQQP